jgi:hypothetical protein
MVLMVTYPLCVVTGIMRLIMRLSILSQLLHFFMAVMATPFVLCHPHMALISSG